MRCIPLAALLVTLSAIGLAQSIERYRIVEVDRVDPKISYGDKSISTLIPFEQPSLAKSIFMIDSQTGKTWILTKTDVLTNKVSTPTLVWVPILFAPIDSANREQELLQLKNGMLKEFPEDMKTKVH